MNSLNKKQTKLEYLRLLEEKERRQKSNPLKYFNPYLPKRHEKQIAIHENDKRVRAFIAGNRTGKTQWGGQEVAYYALNKHPHRETGEDIEIWVGCPSFDVQKDTTQKKLESYIPENEIKKVSYVHSGIWKELILKNGNKITFKSYEQGREKWQGAGKKLIWFDEEPPYSIWEEALMRHEAGITLDVILTMTPVNGMTWVYDEIYMATDREDLFVITAGWDDNPYLTEEQKEDMARGLTDEAIEVRKYGRFVSRVGLVCNWWNREVHVIDIGEYKDDWSYFEVVDGGWSDPVAYLFVAMDQMGRVLVLDGFREKQLRTEEIYEKRQAIVDEIPILGGVGDSDNPRLINELSSLGMEIAPINKIVEERGKSWDEALAEALAYYGMSNRLFISSHLKWLVQEAENLKWLEVKRKEGMEIKPKWNDHRRFGHHFDGIRALSYLIISETIEPLEIKKLPLGHGKQKGTYVGWKNNQNEDDSNIYEQEDFSKW